MLKKLISVIMLICIFPQSAVICHADNVTAEDVKTAMADDIPRGDVLNSLLEVKNEDGIAVKDFSSAELFYRIYQIKGDSMNLGKNMFSEYSGDFGSEYDLDFVEWGIPVIENGEIVGEYTYDQYQYEKKETVKEYSKLKDDGVGFVMIYPFKKLAEIIEENNIGKPIDIKGTWMQIPSHISFVYVKTEKGEYIIPTRNIRLSHYGDNEEWIIEEPFKKCCVYSADEFVKQAKRSINDRIKRFSEIPEYRENMIVNIDGEDFVIDKNGNKTPLSDIVISETPKPTAAPKETLKPTKTPTSSASPKPTLSPTPSPIPTVLPTETPTPTAMPELNVKTDNGKIAVDIAQKPVTFTDAQPFVDESDRTQIPIRALAQTLDFEVSWNGESLTATLTKDSTTITIKIGEKTIMKNNESIKMDTAAKVVEDRTYIPLRFVGEAFGYRVNWVN